MISLHSGLLACLFCLTCFIVPSFAAATANPIVEGNARFTVITPNVIRLEYAPDGKFIDEPSFFAAKRDARTNAFQSGRKDGSLEIQTDAIRLTYTPDGKPFHAGNLRAEIKGAKTPWQAGVANTENLGGTLRTLDKIKGPVPLDDGLLSRNGWYLLDDSKSPLFEKGWVAERPAGSGTDWYLFGYGKDFAAALRSLTAVSGASPMPRKYALGAWTSRFWPYTTAEFKDLVKGYREHGFPLDVVVMDMNWHVSHKSPKEDRFSFPTIWTSYTWDRTLIPDPSGLLAWFKSQGVHITLNDHPADGVQAHDKTFASFMREMGQSSKDAPIPFDAGSQHYMETFWKTTHAPIDAMGNDFWWLDWQQDPNTRSMPGVSNLALLNWFYFEKSKAGGLRGQSFSRWSGWGDQRYPIQFSGDTDINWSMLAFEVPFTSVAGNVGCFYWSHDIGGHQKGLGRNDENYTRWVQFGALTAALRSHSTLKAETDRRPWTYSKEACDAMRTAFHLRAELMPYIYSSAWQVSSETQPLTRPMYLAYPDAQEAYENPQEYLFGDHLLVAPITTPGLGPKKLAAQRVWFPPGEWRNWFTGEQYKGPREILVPATLDEFPLFVRAGTAIPMQPYSDHPATAPLKELVLQIFPGNNGVTNSCTLYEDDGETSQYEKDNRKALTRIDSQSNGAATTITIHPTSGAYAGQPKSRALTVHLRAVKKPVQVTVDGRKTEAAYDAGSQQATVRLANQPIGQAVTISIEAAPVAPDELSAAALARRLEGLDRTKDANAVALAHGAGLFPRNIDPWLLDRNPPLRFYAPEGFRKDTAATLTQDGKSTTVTVKAGENFPPDAATKLVSTKDKPATLRVSGPDGAFDLTVPPQGAR